MYRKLISISILLSLSLIGFSQGSDIQYSFFEYADNYRTFTELGADPTYITINSNYYSILGGLKWIF